MIAPRFMSLQIQPKPEEQQPEADLSIAFLTWFEENKRLIAIGFGLVSAAVVVGIVNRNIKDSAERSANAAMFAVLAPGAKSVSADALAKVAADHSGTKAAERAQLLAAAQLFEEGRHADAQKAFEAFDASYPDSALASTAVLGIAAALDAQNKTAEAISAYAAFISRFQDDALLTDARLSKARVHEAVGQFKEALALYDELGRGGFNAAAQDAALRRANLLQAHPELAPAPQVLTNSVNISAPTNAAR
jgi:TolA-binding protein